MDPHEEFVELCALSTSGELTVDEQTTLAKHLKDCPECRKAIHQFEAVVDRAVPALSFHLGDDSNARTNSSAVAVAEGRLFEPSSREKDTSNGSTSGTSDRALAFVQTTSRFRKSIECLESYLPYAAGIILILTLGLVLLRKDDTHVAVIADPPEEQSERVEAPGQTKMPPDGEDSRANQQQLAERDKVITELRSQIQRQGAELASLRAREQDLQNHVQVTEAEKNRFGAERDALALRAAAAETSLLKLQKDLEVAVQAREDDTLRSSTIEGKLAEASTLLGDRDRTIGQLQSLLDHDRDIRELMGARDLYIAEVYDVARSGEMQKPCGRVFLTKGKSLIFYAYDLDEAPGLKNGSTFQAWGSLGPDRQHALNLGVFYEDNVAKKRWIVRSDDAKTLQQIQAVFVTIEPKGGSDRPSGKPFLFAYLRADSNHP
jgi:Anti-sigma-K factor rskA, C-terminal